MKNILERASGEFARPVWGYCSKLVQRLWQLALGWMQWIWKEVNSGYCLQGCEEGLDRGWGGLGSEGQGRIKNDFQVLNFNIWRMVVVFIEIGKRGKNRYQRDNQVFSFKC